MITQDGLELPQPGKNAFVCPHCGVYTHQHSFPRISVGGSVLGTGPGTDGDWTASVCERCKCTTIWREERMIWPGAGIGPAPHPQMPKSVLATYDEARAVGAASPRAAAALLRVATEQLVDALEPGSKSLNDKIGLLKKRGLADQVVDALDVLRLYGNDNLHVRRDIEDSDTRATVESLFAVMNIVVDQVVARERQIGALKVGLTVKQQAQIDKRDGISDKPDDKIVPEP